MCAHMVTQRGHTTAGTGFVDEPQVGDMLDVLKDNRVTFEFAATDPSLLNKRGVVEHTWYSLLIVQLDDTPSYRLLHW